MKGPSTLSTSSRNPHYARRRASVRHDQKIGSTTGLHQSHVTGTCNEQIQYSTVGLRSTIPLVPRLVPDVQERVESFGLPVEEQGGNAIGGRQVFLVCVLAVPADDVRVSDWCAGRKSRARVKVSVEASGRHSLVLVLPSRGLGSVLRSTVILSGCSVCFDSRNGSILTDCGKKKVISFSACKESDAVYACARALGPISLPFATRNVLKGE